MYSKKVTEISIRKINNFIFYLAIAGISYMLFFYFDSIILGILLKPEYVGYYKASFSFIFGILGFIYFINLVIVSTFTKLKKRQLNGVFNQVIRYMSYIAIPAIFALLILGKYFIRLFYGYEYLPATLPLYFLSFIIFPALGVNVLLNIFSALEKTKTFAKIIVTTCILNLILNIVLINLFLKISPIWATVGAAISVLISWSFYFIYSLKLAKKEFNIGFNAKTFVKPIIASIIMSLFLLYYLQFVKDVGVISGILIVLFGFLVYFVSMLILRAIRKEELSLLYLIFKRERQGN